MKSDQHFVNTPVRPVKFNKPCFLKEEVIDILCTNANWSIYIYQYNSTVGYVDESYVCIRMTLFRLIST